MSVYYSRACETGARAGALLTLGRKERLSACLMCVVVFYDPERVGRPSCKLFVCALRAKFLEKRTIS